MSRTKREVLRDSGFRGEEPIRVERPADYPMSDIRHQFVYADGSKSPIFTLAKLNAELIAEGHPPYFETT